MNDITMGDYLKYNYLQLANEKKKRYNTFVKKIMSLIDSTINYFRTFIGKAHEPYIKNLEEVKALLREEEQGLKHPRRCIKCLKKQRRGVCPESHFYKGKK